MHIFSIQHKQLTWFLFIDFNSFFYNQRLIFRTKIKDWQMSVRFYFVANHCSDMDKNINLFRIFKIVCLFYMNYFWIIFYRPKKCCRYECVFLYRRSDTFSGSNDRRYSGQVPSGSLLFTFISGNCLQICWISLEL